MEPGTSGKESGAVRPDPFVRHDFSGASGDEEEGNRLPGRPTWRALVLAVIAAIALSVSATLLLGGSFGFTKVAASTGCGPGSECCPPAAPRSVGR